MESATKNNKVGGFGVTAVFLTTISTILGAILFLRLGFAVGALGFWGTMVIIVLGHLITIPTALAVSEIATNTRVEGGGVYYIISRSFGLKIGSTIGLTLFFSQAISVAFYVIAFTEAFSPFFYWWNASFGFELPKQVISIPSLIFLGMLILRKGSDIGMKMLYLINAILFISMFMFFIGSPIEVGEDVARFPGNNFDFINKDNFFPLFVICFPAFTGMTAGVGLSGDLKNPGKAIPLGNNGCNVGRTCYIYIGDMEARGFGIASRFVRGSAHYVENCRLGAYCYSYWVSSLYILVCFGLYPCGSTYIASTCQRQEFSIQISKLVPIQRNRQNQ